MTEISTIALSGRGEGNERLKPSGQPDHAIDGAVDYWNALIPEQDAAAFLNITDRTLQNYRQKGGGPKYMALSSRCLRYRRIDLRDWAEERTRRSTSDPGEDADSR